MIANFVTSVLILILARKEVKAEAERLRVEAGQVFLAIESLRRRNEEEPAKFGVGSFRIGEMPPPPPRVPYLPRRPRDDLHELDVVNRLSELERARLEFENREGN